MNEITIGDKIYISSKRAAEITGYAKDYVGQLCREGHIDAKMVGRGWYVYEPSIRAHRFGSEAESYEEESAATVDTETEPVANASQVVDEVEDTTGWNTSTYTSETPEELPYVSAPVYEEPAVPAEKTLNDMQAAWREWFDRKQEVLDTPELESPEVLEARHEAENDAEEEVSVPLHRVHEEDLEEVVEDEAIEYAEEVIDEAQPIVQAGIRPAEGSFSVPIHTIPEYNEPEPEVVRPSTAIAHDVIPVSMQKRSLTGYTSATPEEARVIEERIVRRKGTATVSTPAVAGSIRNTSNAPAIALLIGISVLSVAVAAIGSGKADRYFKTSLFENSAFDFLVGNREYIRN